MKDYALRLAYLIDKYIWVFHVAWISFFFFLGLKEFVIK